LLAAERSIGHELGLAEARGDDSDDSDELKAQLDETQRQRQAAIRRRVASTDAIVALEPALHERREHAIEAVKAFEIRYNATIQTLQSLWSEAAALSRALKVEISTPLPVKVSTSPIDGTTRAVPVRSSGTIAPLDPATAKLGERADALDGALAMIGAVKQSKEIDARYYRLSQDRGMSGEHNDVYRVLLTFRSWDGMEFSPGQLVDAGFVGDGMLARLMMGRRQVEPVELGAKAA
jgi:hypothetical protein